LTTRGQILQFFQLRKVHFRLQTSAQCPGGVETAYSSTKTQIMILQIRNLAMAVSMALTATGVAMAAPLTFSISGQGITASGTFTYSDINLASYGSVPGYGAAWKIDGVTGTFADSTLGISGNFVGVMPAIMDYTSIPRPAGYPDPTDPPNRGVIEGTGLTFGKISYDNIIYPGGNSPNTCPNYYSYGGGLLDLFGMLLNVDSSGDPYFVNIWSNGNLDNPSNPLGLDYGIAIGRNVGGDKPFQTLRYLGDGNIYETTPNLYTASGITFSAVPEPSTYAMVIAGLGIAAFGAWRRSKRA
jgi:hypothetical protein